MDGREYEKNTIGAEGKFWDQNSMLSMEAIAVNTLAIPVVTYSFNIINWTVEDLWKIDPKTRKLLTMWKCATPKQKKIGFTYQENQVEGVLFKLKELIKPQ